MGGRRSLLAAGAVRVCNPASGVCARPCCTAGVFSLLDFSAVTYALGRD